MGRGSRCQVAMPERAVIQDSRFERMKPEEVLLFLGGLLTVLLGAFFFAIQWVQGIPSSRLLDQIAVLVVDLLVGMFLLITFVVARKNSMSAAIMAIAISIILMIFGGAAGLIGGVVGMLGGLLAIALPYLSIKT